MKQKTQGRSVLKMGVAKLRGCRATWAGRLPAKQVQTSRGQTSRKGGKSSVVSASMLARVRLARVMLARVRLARVRLARVKSASHVSVGKVREAGHALLSNVKRGVITDSIVNIYLKPQN